ncbi:hypothetical protein E2320_003480 [Naja naja]|nr:hypothetical protein E2320_003480 [Naja naja]
MRSSVFVSILFYILGSQEVVSTSFPTGAVQTECRDRYFWIWLDKSSLGQNSWSYSVFNDLGQRISVTDYIATQCGFTHGVDHYGNPEIRVSFLACSVRNAAQGAMNQVWHVVFHFQNGSVQDMMATQAYNLGYGFNTTATRVVFRTPYNTQQTEVAVVQGLEVEMAQAMIFYKQTWLILMVDTAVGCPVNPPTFTASNLRWASPRILSSLVAYPNQFEDETIEMGLDGRRIDRTTIVQNGYSFLTDTHFISITSDVIDNRYGTMYSIKLLLDRRWRGDESDRTRHRIFKSIRTPFAPQIPVLTDILPVFEGFCEGGQIGVVMIRGNLDHFWVPFVGSLQLTNELAVSQNYTIQDDGHYFFLSAPFLATGLMYEIFVDFILCFPNGTITATMLSLDTKPELNPRKTHLRDKNCRPVEVDDTKALFTFSVSTCGTLRKFEENYLVYENEVVFEREMIPKAKAIITRDPQYRLTLRCRYRLNETLRVLVQQFLRRGLAAGPNAFHSKAYQKKRTANGHNDLQLAGGASTDAKGKTWFWFLAFSVALCGLATTINTVLPVQLFGH